jgi:hypothetical protein
MKKITVISYCILITRQVIASNHDKGQFHQCAITVAWREIHMNPQRKLFSYIRVQDKVQRTQTRCTDDRETSQKGIAVTPLLIDDWVIQRICKVVVSTGIRQSVVHLRHDQIIVIVFAKLIVPSDE